MSVIYEYIEKIEDDFTRLKMKEIVDHISIVVDLLVLEHFKNKTFNGLISTLKVIFYY